MGVNADSKIPQNRQGGGLDPVHRHQMTFTNIVMETTPPKPSFIAQKIFRPASLVRIARNRLSGAPTSLLLPQSLGSMGGQTADLLWLSLEGGRGATPNFAAI